MKKFKLYKIDLKKLVILNIILTIFLGSVLGIQFRIPPFDIFKDNVLKPLLKPSSVKKDKEMDMRIDNFWKNIENKNDNIDYYGGIDWKKYIFWAEEVKKGGYILLFRHGEREKWGEGRSMSFQKTELN